MDAIRGILEPLANDRTGRRLVMAYDPQGATEDLGAALGVLRRRVQASVDNFKKLVESGRAGRLARRRARQRGRA